MYIVGDCSYRPYGKGYLPITYCFRINFPKATDTDTYRNCFGTNKDGVTDTDPQKSPIPMPIGNGFGINRVTVADTNPHPVPSPSSSAGLFGLIAGTRDFVHNAPKILDFPRDFVHTAPKCCPCCRKAP